MALKPIRADRIPPEKPDYAFVPIPRDFLTRVWPELEPDERVLSAYLWLAMDKKTGVVPRRREVVPSETGLPPRVFAAALKRLESLDLIATAPDGRVQVLSLPPRFRSVRRAG